MTFEETKLFESQLLAKGYRYIHSGKAEYHDDYEYYKAYYVKTSDNREVAYQIFFCFWNFEKYQPGAGYSVSIIVMPDSCTDDVGRRDLHLSVDWFNDIERVEKCAASFYIWISKID